MPSAHATHDILEKIRHIDAHYASITETVLLRDQAIVAYGKKVLSKLTAIFKSTEDNPENRRNELKTFLDENWRFIQSTALSYTALPHSDITGLLCDIAKFVAVEENINDSNAQPIGVLQLLMPTVNTTHMNDIGGKGNLHPQLIEGQWVDIDVSRVLQTHILGREANMLIPVSLVATLATETDGLKLINPYFNMDHDESLATLAIEEIRRLRDFSPATQSVFDAIKDCDILRYDESNLLGHLRVLISQLYFNSVSGTGQEETAGLGVDAALIHFRNYYEQLGSDAQNNIPRKVKQELDMLFSFTDPGHSTQEQVRNNMSSCIATRRTALQNALAGEEETLAKIGLIGANKESLLKDAEHRLAATKEALCAELSSPSQRGYDHLDLTLNILKVLACPLRLSKPDDLVLFNHLSPSEIAELCQDEAIQQQLVEVIETLENLVILCLQTAPEKLEALLKSASTSLANRFIKTPPDLSSLLISFNPEQITRILRAFKDNLPSIIKKGSDFIMVSNALSTEQRLTFIESFKDNLPSIIKNRSDFIMVSKALPLAQSLTFIESFKGNLPSIIKNGSDFSMVSKALSPAQSLTFIESFKDNLPSIIRNGSDFSMVLDRLPPAQSLTFIESFKGNLPSIIKGGFDFIMVLDALPPAQRLTFIESFIDNLPSIIRNYMDFGEVLKALSPEQGSTFIESFKDNLPSIIKDRRDFIYVLDKQSPELSTTIIDSFKNNLPSIIKDPDDFIATLRSLSPAQSLTFIESFINNLPSIIKNPYDFIRVLKALSPAQSITFIESFNFSRIIPDKHCLKQVLTRLPLEHYKTLVESIKDNLPRILHAGDVDELFRDLLPEQRTTFLESLKDKLPSIIKGMYDFIFVLDELPPEQRIAFFESFKDNLTSMISSPQNFSYLLKALSPEQSIAFIESFNFPSIIPDRYCLHEVLTMLPLEHYKTLVESFKDNLPRIFKYDDDFKKFLELLSPKTRTTFLESLKDKLPSIIKRNWDFIMVLDELPPEKRTAFVESFKDKLPSLIKKTYDFKKALEKLSPEQSIIVIESLKGLPSIFTEAFEFKYFFSALSPEKRSIIFESLKDNLSSVTKGGKDFSQVLKDLKPKQCTAFFESFQGDRPSIIKDKEEASASTKAADHSSSTQSTTQYREGIAELKSPKADDNSSTCKP